jgi:pectate lyase
VPGLAANQSYDLRIIELNNGNPTGRTDYARSLRPHAFERQGFAFSSTSPFGQTTGAYNTNGTLRDDAIVIYITPQNVANFTNPWNTTRGFAGLFNSSRMQNRGVNNAEADGISLRNATPVAIRFMGGRVTRSAAGAGEMVPVNRTANITIEGIGTDAEVFGFGFSAVRTSNIVIRNIHFRNHTDDAILIQGDASDDQNRHGPLPNINQGGRNIANGVMSVNAWVTHNRFTVDNANSDSHVDIVRSTYFTQSFNIFTRNGRGGLAGNGLTNPHYRGTYHNNHYIDTNSRAPRLRAGEIHVFNNFYDYTSHTSHDYAIGAGHHAHVIAEGNYFNNTRRPFIISNQGNGGSILTADQPGFIITSLTTAANHHSSTHRHVEQRIFNLAATLVPNQLTNVTNFDATRDQGFPRQDNNRPGRAFTWTEFSSPQAWPMPVTVTTAQQARQRVIDHAGTLRQINQIRPYSPPTQAPGGGGGTNPNPTPTPPPSQGEIASGNNVAVTGGGSGDGTFNAVIQQLADVSSHNLRQAELELDGWMQTDGTSRWMSIMVQLSDGSLLTLRNRTGSGNAIDRFVFGMASGSNLQARQATATWGGDQTAFGPAANVLGSASAVNGQFGNSLRNPSNSAATANHYRVSIDISGSTITATLTANGDTGRQMHVTGRVADGATIHSVHAWSHGTATQSTLNIPRWSLSTEPQRATIASGSNVNVAGGGSGDGTFNAVIQELANVSSHNLRQAELELDGWMQTDGSNRWMSVMVQLSDGSLLTLRNRTGSGSAIDRFVFGMASGSNLQSRQATATWGGDQTAFGPAANVLGGVSAVNSQFGNSLRSPSNSAATANHYRVSIDVTGSTITATLTVNGDTGRQMHVTGRVADGATIHSVHAWSHGTAAQSTLTIPSWSLSQ